MRALLETIWPFYSFLRVLFIFLDIVLVFVFVFAFFELLRFRPVFFMNPQRPRRRKKKSVHHAVSPEESWTKIQARLTEISPDAARLAVIEADAFVNNYLKHHGYAGETFADRLSHIDPDTVPAIDRVWAAHRLRNDLVHTPGFQINNDRAKKALEDYEAFLREMGVFETPTPRQPKPPMHEDKPEEKIVFSSADE